MSTIEKDEKQGESVVLDKPHPHDVLCGRGGRTNLHKGNIWFRRLVRSNRALYRTCPKHTKLLVAKAVVKAVQGQDPPGHFLEPDKASGGWKEIPYKRALDKTSQALRERDPEAESVTGYAQSAREAAASATNDSSLEVLTEATLQQAGLSSSGSQSLAAKPSDKKKTTSKKRKEATQFQKPSWWSWGTPIDTTGQLSTKHASNPIQPAAKKNKTDNLDDVVPLPVDGLQTRQSSFFKFLSSTGIFGSGAQAKAPKGPGMVVTPNNATVRTNGFRTLHSSCSVPGTITSMPNNNGWSNQPQQGLSISNNAPFAIQPPGSQPHDSFTDAFEPTPLNGDEKNGHGNLKGNTRMDPTTVRHQMQLLRQPENNDEIYQNAPKPVEAVSAATLPESISNVADNNIEVAAPPKAGLTKQVSDWLALFFPPGGGEVEGEAGAEDNEISPPQQSMQRGISSTLFNLTRSPSQFLTNLKTGVTSMFMDNSPGKPGAMGQVPPPVVPPPAGLNSQNLGNSSQSFGIPSESKPDSLLDDTEESPLEAQLRNVRSL
eukprot:scaffold925_cov129-Cylindrotheca_fusiformis.AAC.24